MFFDNKGRANTELTSKDVYKKSRYYFQINEDLKDKIDLKEIYKNLKENLNISITFNDFEEKIKKIKEKVNGDEKTKNLSNCIGVPFIIPKVNVDDLSLVFKNIFLPAVTNSYKKKFPNYDFVDHVNDDFEKKFKILDGSRYSSFLEAVSKKDVVGIFYPSMNEFSYPAALDTIQKLPEIFSLCGPIDLASVLTGFPQLLSRNEKYPPMLWLSSIVDSKNQKVSYHFEPYGYNLTFNKRAHLDHVAEYWWHSIIVYE